MITCLTVWTAAGRKRLSLPYWIILANIQDQFYRVLAGWTLQVLVTIAAARDTIRPHQKIAFVHRVPSPEFGQRLGVL